MCGTALWDTIPHSVTFATDRRLDMDPFARIIVGYHGCTEAFARDLILGKYPIGEWQPSTNDWDWLGHGIYF